MITYLRKVLRHNSPVRLWYTRLQAVAAAVRLPLPAKMPLLIGVTGTDGKTTTVEMVAHILDTLNVPVMSASSYAVRYDSTVTSMSKRTTPSPWAVRRLVRDASERGCKVVVLEASSHSLVQWRLLGLHFNVTVLTNITHEHLNFHKTREAYAAAKKLLFTTQLTAGGSIILPTNDDYGRAWLAELHGTPYTPPEALTDMYGTTFEHNGAQYSLPMLGGYNAGNALAAALAVASALPAYTVPQCLEALRDFSGVPGRMQLVPEAAAYGITALVDFALTEHAMESALTAARALTRGQGETGKVVVVFGASGGQHDASVHPGLARAAARGADIAIVTDDEPYDGDPAAIRANLITHIEKAATGCEYHNIADRREAIAMALRKATDGDVVIVTGMGHYTSRTMHGQEVPWNDADVLREELRKLR